MSAPEFRTCPMSGRVVILAPERADRPLPRPRPAAGRRDCPLCPGRETGTEPESYAVRAPGRPADGPGWRLRVVPNKFPFVRPTRPGEAAPPGAATGVQELVVETERHCDPVDLTTEELARVVLAWRDRMVRLAELDWCRAVTAFRNVGAEAGASLDHPHSQIVALPLALPGMLREWQGAARLFADTHQCAFCAMLAEPTRRVAESGGFAAACPFAPRFARETWVIPTEHAGRFEDITDAAAPDLAALLRDLFARLRRVVPGAAFNLTLHTAPARGSVPPGWHWHLKLLPRTTTPAGFEWASDCFVNPVTPEMAARELREAGSRVESQL